jgi:hypothetical protein
MDAPRREESSGASLVAGKFVVGEQSTVEALPLFCVSGERARPVSVLFFFVFLFPEICLMLV